MAETIDFLVVVLPTVIALLSVYVSIKLTRGEEHRVWWGVIVALGIGTSALTWVSQSNGRRDHAKELGALHDKLDKSLQGEQYLRGQLDTQNKLLVGLTANSDPKQIAALLTQMNTQRSTLKKETLTLCTEIEQWFAARSKKDPPPTVAIPGKPTQKESDEQNAYWQKLQGDYYARFAPKTLAILQQYASKGIDVRMLEQSASYGFMPNNIVLELRSFANRLDENGNLKQ